MSATLDRIDFGAARALLIAMLARAVKDARSRDKAKQREAQAAREFLSSERAAQLTALALPDMADRLSADEICKRLLTTDLD